MIDFRLFFLLVFIPSQQVTAQQQQSMFGDFFSSAISVFKPLVEERRSHIREQSTFVRPLLDSQRDVRVMGAPARTPMNDAVPICNGDGKLCAFIACQAENMKNDQTFANLNLAAQVMGDKKLRHQVGNNPEAINAVCVDSGMDESRCGTFTRGFQMISKLINSLEDPIDNMQRGMPTPPAMQSAPFNAQSTSFNTGLSPIDTGGMERVPSGRIVDQLPGRRTVTRHRNGPGVGTVTRQLNRPGIQRTVWRGANSWGSQVTRTSPMRTVTVERFSMEDGRRVRKKTVVRRVPRSSKPIVPSRSTQTGRQQLMQLPQQDDAVFGHAPVIRRLDDYDFSWASPRGMPSPQGMPAWSSSASRQQPSWSASSDTAPARAFGSQTWSSNKEAINPAQSENPLDRNDLLASFTPLPPTAAPLAFPTVKSVLPSMEDLFLRPFRMDPALEKMLTPIKIEPILRHRRHTDDFVRVVEHLARSSAPRVDVGSEKEEESSRRVKRAEDYYDQADAEDTARPSSSRGGQRSGSKGGNTPDYYDQVESGQGNRHRNTRPGRPKQQRNCFELLG